METLDNLETLNEPNLLFPNELSEAHEHHPAMVSAKRDEGALRTAHGFRMEHCGTAPFIPVTGRLKARIFVKHEVGGRRHLQTEL